MMAQTAVLVQRSEAMIAIGAALKAADLHPQMYPPAKWVGYARCPLHRHERLRVQDCGTWVFVHHENLAGRWECDLPALAAALEIPVTYLVKPPARYRRRSYEAAAAATAPPAVRPVFSMLNGAGESDPGSQRPVLEVVRS